MNKTTMSKIIILLALLMGGLNLIPKSNAQNLKEIEISVVPQFGFSFSYFELAKGFSKNNLINTKRFIARKDFYWGLGFQARYHNDWITTATISNFFMGGGYQTQHFGKSTTSEITNCFSLNIEKNILKSNQFTVLKQDICFNVNILWGAGMYWIPPSDRVIETNSGVVFGVYRELNSTPLNNVSGNVNIGLTTQLLVNKKPKLKLGVIYTYGWSPSRTFDYKLIYPVPINPEENFKINTGKHRLCLSMEIPIVLYRNKLQKKYYK